MHTYQLVASIIFGLCLSTPIQADVKVGLLLPSAEDRDVGAAMVAAAQSIVERANGRLPRDRQIQLILQNGNCDPKDTTAQAVKLIDSKVQYVIGAQCGSNAAAMLTAAGTLFVTVGEETTTPASASELLFYVQPSAVRLKSVAMAVAPRTLLSGKFSIANCDPQPLAQISMGQGHPLRSLKIDDEPQVCNPPPKIAPPDPAGPRPPGLDVLAHPWAIQTYVAMQMLTNAFSISNSEVQSIVARNLRTVFATTIWGQRKFSNIGVLSPYGLNISVPEKSSFKRRFDYDRADADPAKDAGCTRTKSTTVHSCTTDDKGRQTCTDTITDSYDCQ